MKTDVPWYVKGVGRQARETAREAARRSGMSVGEWLATVINDSASDGSLVSRQGARAQPAPDDFAERNESLRPTRRMREEQYPDHDETFRPRPRKYAEYDDRQRLPASADDYPRAGHPPSAWDEGVAPRRGVREPAPDDFSEQEDAQPTRRMRDERYPDHAEAFRPRPLRYAEYDNRQRVAARVDDYPRVDHPPAVNPVAPVQPVVDQGFAAVNHRLDSLTQQLDQLARLNAANAANAADAQISRPRVRDDETSRQFAVVISKVGRGCLLGQREDLVLVEFRFRVAPMRRGFPATG